MDLSKLPIRPTKRSRPTAPEDIFKSLTLRGTIENMWGLQLEALRGWEALRTESDVIAEMTTGGGKTLVGLLIGQSLVNESSGKVLYVCATKQLIEQTAARAQECGIRVATYFGGNWTDREVFDGCIGLCITNYAAVFNGRSIFRGEDFRGIVFEAQEPAIAIEAASLVNDFKLRQIARRKRDTAKPLRGCANEAKRPRFRPVPPNRLNAHRLAKQRASHDLPCADGFGCRHCEPRPILCSAPISAMPKPV